MCVESCPEVGQAYQVTIVLQKAHTSVKVLVVSDSAFKKEDKVWIGSARGHHKYL